MPIDITNADDDFCHTCHSCGGEATMIAEARMSPNARVHYVMLCRDCAKSLYIALGVALLKKEAKDGKDS